MNASVNRGKRNAKLIREKRTARLIRENPRCILCGGVGETVGLDHVPPQSSFPRGHHPDEYDFPACHVCNQSTRHFDQIFSFYVIRSDHNDDNRDLITLKRLESGIANNYPKALPEENLSARAKRAGLRQMGARKPPGVLYKDLTLAGIPSVFGEAAKIVARKMACAIFYKEFGEILPRGQKIVASWHHLYDPRSTSFVNYFNERMNAYRKPVRSNIKNYGDRLVYKFAYNEDERFFGIAAQFGKGIFLWALAARSDFQIDESEGPEVYIVGDPWVSDRAAELIEACR